MLYYSTNRPCEYTREYGAGKNACGYICIFRFCKFCYFAKKQIVLKLTVALGGGSPKCFQAMNEDIIVLFVTVVWLVVLCS